MLEKIISYDHHILEDGQIQVRRITRIMEDGQEIGKTFHRHVVSPISDTTKEDSRCKLITGVLFTQELKDEYTSKLAENEVISEPK